MNNLAIECALTAKEKCKTLSWFDRVFHYTKIADFFDFKSLIQKRDDYIQFLRSRVLGTDKEKSGFINLIRWTNPRTIKENFYANIEWSYDYMK